MPDSFSGLQEIKITPFLSDFHHIDQTWFVVSFLSVVSQLHSTRGLQTMSSLCDSQVAQLSIPYPARNI